ASCLGFLRPPKNGVTLFDQRRTALMDAKKNKAIGTQGARSTKQMEGLDLDSVIERAQGHDAEALGEIHRRYVRRVFGLCRYMLDSRESAEDATSEVFLKLQRSIERYN